MNEDCPISPEDDAPYVTQHDVVKVPSVRREHTLLSTTDATMWAEEFVRIFRGRTIGSDTTESVDESTMVAWFAPAIETGRSAGRRAAEEGH
jgi:hypothetical protein